MIPHPSVETLLDKYGNTATGRPRARAAMTAAIVVAARQEAAATGRSPRCREGDHHRVVDGYAGGCANTGATCICECHDPKEG